MAYVAKRNSDRCPTHPGALLREDVIAATGKTKAEIAPFTALSKTREIGVTFNSQLPAGCDRRPVNLTAALKALGRPALISRRDRRTPNAELNLVATT